MVSTRASAVWLVLALASPPRALAFVPASFFGESGAANTLSQVQATGTVHRVWDLPADVTSNEGLSAGIRYAWDPEMCNTLLPRFKEDISGFSFISCDSLRAAWARALNTWSVHHPHVSFTDVSNECNAAGDATGGPVNDVGCSIAQIWITTQSTASGYDAAATCVNKYSYSSSFRHTNGLPANTGVWKTDGSVIGFNTELCWYLDSLFCSTFHGLKEQFGSEGVFLAGQVLLWGTWAIAAISMCVISYNIIARHCKVLDLNSLVFFEEEEERLQEEEEDDEKREEIREELAIQAMKLLDTVSKLNILATTLRLTFVWAPPILYVYIFLPCWECYDFEAAASHEIGHALGLMHPDQAAELGFNLAWNASCDYSGSSEFGSGDAAVRGGCAQPRYEQQWADCEQPWRDVVATPANASAAKSIMTAFTQFNKDVCLYQDDLDALNTLYPICEHAVRTPQCYKSESYIGLVRLAIFVGAPVALVLAIIICCHSGLTRYETKKRERIRSEHEEQLSNLEKEMLKYKKRRTELLNKGWHRATVHPSTVLAVARNSRDSGGGGALALVAAQAKAAAKHNPKSAGRHSPTKGSKGRGGNARQMRSPGIAGQITRVASLAPRTRGRARLRSGGPPRHDTHSPRLAMCPHRARCSFHPQAPSPSRRAPPPASGKRAATSRPRARASWPSGRLAGATLRLATESSTASAASEPSSSTCATAARASSLTAARSIGARRRRCII